MGSAGLLDFDILPLSYLLHKQSIEDRRSYLRGGELPLLTVNVHLSC